MHLIPDIAPCSLLRHTKNRSITSNVANKARLPQWYVAIIKKWPFNISAKYWVDEKLSVLQDTFTAIDATLITSSTIPTPHTHKIRCMGR